MEFTLNLSAFDIIRIHSCCVDFGYVHFELVAPRPLFWNVSHERGVFFRLDKSNAEFISTILSKLVINEGEEWSVRSSKAVFEIQE